MSTKNDILAGLAGGIAGGIVMRVMIHLVYGMATSLTACRVRQEVDLNDLLEG